MRTCTQCEAVLAGQYAYISIMSTTVDAGRIRTAHQSYALCEECYRALLAYTKTMSVHLPRGRVDSREKMDAGGKD